MEELLDPAPFDPPPDNAQLDIEQVISATAPPEMSCLSAISISLSTSSQGIFANLEERSASKTSNARCRWDDLFATRQILD